MHHHLGSRHGVVRVRHHGRRPVPGDRGGRRYHRRAQPHRADHLGQRWRGAAHSRRGSADADGRARQGRVRPRRHRRTARGRTVRHRRRPGDDQPQRHPPHHPLPGRRRQRDRRRPDRGDGHPPARSQHRGGRRCPAGQRRRHRCHRCALAARVRRRVVEPVRTAHATHAGRDGLAARHRTRAGRIHLDRRDCEGRERCARAGRRVRRRGRRRGGAGTVGLHARRPAGRVLCDRLRVHDRGVRSPADPPGRSGLADRRR